MAFKLLLKGKQKLVNGNWGKIVLDKGNYKDKACIMVTGFSLVWKLKELNDYIHLILPMYIANL